MAIDPFQLFEIWFAEAQAGEINDPEAMALATADARGRPSVRMVLLKGHGPEGFTFYTNERSAKGEQLAENPRGFAALPLEVPAPAGPHRWRGRGRPGPEADAYWATRAREFAARRLGVGAIAPAR